MQKHMLNDLLWPQCFCKREKIYNIQNFMPTFPPVCNLLIIFTHYSLI